MPIGEVKIVEDSPPIGVVRRPACAVALANVGGFGGVVEVEVEVEGLCRRRRRQDEAHVNQSPEFQDE